MDKCFLCGKPAVKKVEIEVGSSRTSIHHHDGHHNHGSHLDHGTTRHYALQPLCEDCIKQREAEALEAMKAMGKAGELVVGGIYAGLKLAALFLFGGLVLLAAIGGALFYFSGHR